MGPAIDGSASSSVRQPILSRLTTRAGSTLQQPKFVIVPLLSLDIEVQTTMNVYELANSAEPLSSAGVAELLAEKISKESYLAIEQTWCSQTFHTMQRPSRSIFCRQLTSERQKH